MLLVDLGGRTEKVEVFLFLKTSYLRLQNESHIPSFPELLKADQLNHKDHLSQKGMQSVSLDSTSMSVQGE